MDFDDMLKKLAEQKALPEMAVLQLDGALSEEVKAVLLHKSPREVAEILNYAIRKINNGSIERIDQLVRKQL